MSVICNNCIDGKKQPNKEVWCKRYAIIHTEVYAKYHGCYMGKEKEDSECVYCDMEPPQPCQIPLDKRPQDCPFQKEINGGMI